MNCQCGLPAGIFQVVKDDNPNKGRWFYGCGNNRSCKLFQFQDGQPSLKSSGGGGGSFGGKFGKQGGGNKYQPYQQQNQPQQHQQQQHQQQFGQHPGQFGVIPPPFPLSQSPPHSPQQQQQPTQPQAAAPSDREVALHLLADKIDSLQNQDKHIIEMIGELKEQIKILHSVVEGFSSK